MKQRLATFALITTAALPSAAEEPSPQEQPTPFDQGRFRISLALGGGAYAGGNYFVIGVGSSYLVLPGFEIGFDFEQWLGSRPYITKLSPQLRYVLYQVGDVAPYIGVFYRHWFVWGATDPLRGSDFDTVGGRSGLVYVVGSNTYIGAGVGVEIVVSRCNESCSVFYPELTLAMSL